jgi:hypothetical protein
MHFSAMGGLFYSIASLQHFFFWQFVHQLITYEVESMANPAVDPAPFSRWTLRDKAAQRRSPTLQGLPQKASVALDF